MNTPGEHRKHRRLPILVEPQEAALRTWLLLARTFGRIERRLEEVGGAHGLSLPQFEVLVVLSYEQGISQQDLAGRLLVTKGNVCAMIARMEANDLVERRSDPDDRRANRIYLTKRGVALLAQTVPDHHAVVDEVMSPLSDGELQTLHQLLDRLEDGLER